ncbi:MAG: amidohydrolase family protein [Cytophagaceae bacterium]|nr:amidohydrolase family protein [Gemmatimonadaceae bacterium]
MRHALPFLLVALGASALEAQDRAIVIRGGTLIPMNGPQIPNGTLVLRGGKIVALGTNVPVPAGAEVVDARGRFVMPGLVDAISHIGIDNNDLNEPTDPVTPQNRAWESYNPFGTFGSGKPNPLRNIEGLSGGVTTMYIAPADAQLLGGQGAIVKTAGATLDAVLVKEPAAIDIALGNPPKAVARAANRDPYTRMAEVAMLRQALVKGQEYQRNKQANPALPRDLGMEALGRLLRKEIPARIQANNATDIRSALRLGQEFGIDVIIDGGAGAWEFKDELVARKIAVVLGQVSHQYVSNEEIPDKQDYPTPDERLAGRLTNAGVPTALATFSRSFGSLAPAGTGKWLLIDAGISAGYGMTEDQVLKAVTLVPAQILGVADRVGSLEVGKDADVVILDGPPLSVKTWVQRVYVNGELVYTK